MRVLSCLVHDHDLWFVLLAAMMCVIGSFVTVKLIRQTFSAIGPARYHWCLLSAVTAGASIWATHFIAMLGYQPGVPVTFDATLTILSVAIAVFGTAIGIFLTTSRNRIIATLCGGGTIGLSIAAMHYVGMFAYRADGVVKWLPEYVIASLFAAVLIAAFAIDRLRRSDADRARYEATGLLVLAIVTLHFVGMAAFVVSPLPGMNSGADSGAFSAMAAAIAIVASLIVATGISTNFVDVRTRKESNDKLHHIAHHDGLTQLANRHSFSEALTERCNNLADNESGFALFMIDLDRFKPINDTLGHPAGDNVLRKVARRLEHAARKHGRGIDGGHDLVARTGGDEFAIIAHGVTEEADAITIAQRIVEVLSRPFLIDGNIAEISGSVGFALAPRDATDPDTLTHNADVALYAAKADGKNCYFQFQGHLSEAVHERRRIERELRRATAREDFSMVYQPVVDATTGRHIGAEALIRWNCPEEGAVSPAVFIPMAEELGLISRIGTFVLREACTEAAKWSDHLKVAVNISTVQLLDPRLPQIVIRSLQESGLNADRLELEITETALLSNDELALQTLEKLRAIGVSISLDDFGTGYSSLSYLHRFPIDRIKIDRSFVQRLPRDTDSLSIIRAITQLGVNLGKQITAEGIETEDQFAAIASNGCHHMQGFLVSEPVPGEEIREFFQTSNVKSAA